jgi:ABC-type molybdate transport system substrate-binding protein
VVVKSSQKKEAAKAFLEYIKSAAGKAVMDKYGFTTPPAGEVKGKAA